MLSGVGFITQAHITGRSRWGSTSSSLTTPIVAVGMNTLLLLLEKDRDRVVAAAVGTVSNTAALLLAVAVTGGPVMQIAVERPPCTAAAWSARD